MRVMTEQSYIYGGQSTVTDAAVQLATSGGLVSSKARELTPVAHPYFFSGFVEYPQVVSAALLIVARVARTRFYVPPGMVAKILREADPVVTSTPESLRFESFSACCGVYARLDLLPAGLDIAHTASGITNVDFNPDMRQALAGIGPGEPMRFNVGSEEFIVDTLDGRTVEKKVPLPPRWLKGFAETQVAAAGMTLQQDLSAAVARSFAQALPRNSPTKSVMWATPSLRGIRLASRPSPGAVCVAGPERLRVLDPVIRHATGLRAYGSDLTSGSAATPSVWQLDLPGARLSVTLSPEKSRGFSGEGGVLSDLNRPSVLDDADLLRATLAFEPRIDVRTLAAESHLPEAQVRSALGALASAGQVGYDLADAAYFHRPLPYDQNALMALHPRLTDAQSLAAAGAVSQDGADFLVRSGENVYIVKLSVDVPRCTCPWYGQYRGNRGPCKHVLAAQLFAQQGY